MFVHHFEGASSRVADYVRVSATDLAVGASAAAASHFGLFDLIENAPHLITLWGGAALVVWRLYRMWRDGGKPL